MDTPLSIVSHDLSYGGQEGLFEIAILHDGEMVYDTWITPDVIGHLDFAGVAGILKDIEELPQGTRTMEKYNGYANYETWLVSVWN